MNSMIPPLMCDPYSKNKHKCLLKQVSASRLFLGFNEIFYASKGREAVLCISNTNPINMLEIWWHVNAKSSTEGGVELPRELCVQGIDFEAARRSWLEQWEQSEWRRETPTELKRRAAGSVS